jgi:hypothetical protein
MNTEEGIDKEWLEEKKRRDQEAFKLKAQNNKFTLVEIIISCQNLPSLDTFSAADPLIAFYTETSYMSNKWTLKGLTEALRDTPNPTFQKSFQIAYYYDTEERIKIELYDVDDFKEDVPLEKHTYVAQKMVLVSDIVKSGVLVTNFENRAKPKMQKLLESKDTKLILKIEEINEKNSIAKFKFSCCDIEMTKGLVFYEIKRFRK